MIELLIALGVAAAIGTALRYITHLRRGALRINRGARDSFFRLADEALASENITSSELDMLDFMARNLMSRSTQLMVLKEYYKLQTEEIKKNEGEVPVEFDHLTEERKTWWGRIYFFWLLAVGSQGSLLALATVDILFTHFDIERRIGLEAADRRAERVVYQLSHAHGH